MKVYVVVVNHHPANAPQNYKTECQIFLDKKEAEGYPDVSGFVKTKAAGERILAMVHEVLGTDKCKTYLDFRPSEPTWIQFKFHKDEFDIEKLDSLTRDSGIITKDIIKQCIYGKSSK